MKFKCVILFLLIDHLSLAQVNKIDSLKNKLVTLTGTERVDCLNKLSLEHYVQALAGTFHNVQTDSAERFASAAYREATEIAYRKGIAAALQNLGEIARDRSDFITSEYYVRQAAVIYEELHASKELSWTYVPLGWSFHCQARYEEARKTYEKGLPYLIATGNNERLGMFYRLISYTYSAQGYNEKAFENMSQAIRISERINDVRGSVSAPQNAGILYKDAGEVEIALSYYRQAAANAKSNNQPVLFHRMMAQIYEYTEQHDSAIYYCNQAIYYVRAATADTIIRKKERLDHSMRIAEIYIKQKYYDKAIAILKESIPFYEKGNDKVKLMRVLLAMARAQEFKNNVDSSFAYTSWLDTIATAAGARPFIRDCYELYWKLYDRRGNTDSAYRYYVKFIGLKESILKDQYLRNIALAAMRSNDEKQKSKIDLLQKDQLIKQQQLTYQQQKLNGESLIRNILIGSLVVITVMGFFIFRSVSLKRKNEILQSERKHSQLKQQASELEMLALRAQMNPHFIFNCLSSINRYILINNTEAASSYLTKFSRLIRMALQHSEKSMISLEKELEMLGHYLDLERLRFKSAFDYSITFKNTIDTSAIFVPPLILQPFAENAIWHGLMHKKGPGHLDIALNLEEKILTCIISDNGIGRSEAALMKSKSAEKAKSMGIQITVERLALLNETTDQKAFFDIEDIVDERGGVTGTKVLLKIKSSSLTDMYD
ncbi:MAG: histidine kinase [Chitinophagaceae bacterium]|nr:histidine kinase [Chitinophagaceae bacterium]